MRPNEQSHRLSVRKGLTVLLSTLCLAACQDDSLMDGQAGNGRLLFNVSTTEAQWADASQTSPAATKHVFEAGQLDGKPLYLRSFGIPTTEVAHNGKAPSTPQTRGIQTNSIQDFHNNFGLFGYLGGLNSTGNPDFLYNLQVKRSGTSNNYSPADNQTYYLPGLGQKVGFYAYAPYNANGLILPATTSTDEPIYTYTVPTDFAAQQDLCFATAEASTSNGTVSLDFKHALAAVRIVVAGDVTPGTVSEVRLMNIKNKATLNGDGSVRELNAESTTDFTLSLQDLAVGNGNNVQLTGDGKAFLLLPQELPQTATLAIVFKNKKGEKHEFSASIGGSGKQWKAGYTYKYTLSFSMVEEPEFNVTLTSGSPNNINYKGGNLTFQVTARQGDQALPYVIEYKYNNSQDGPTSWTTAWSSQNSGITLPTEFSAIGRNGDKGSYTQTITLSEASTKVEGEALNDLNSVLGWGEDSNPTNIVAVENNYSTANCYVVHRSGFHEIPMVYGNALKNGQPNADVMDKGYVDYRGEPITRNNYRADHSSIPPVRAQLLWQDVNGLVTEVHMLDKGEKSNEKNQGRYFIHFRVFKGTITEGNAVIAAIDRAGDIMWSWHIWVTGGGITANMPTVAITGTDGNTRQLLMKPLGWVNGGTKKWKPRNYQIRFRLLDTTLPEEEGKTYFLTTIKQSGTSIQTTGRYTLYQWGRKDPMRPIGINGDGSTGDAEVFANNGEKTYLPLGEQMADWAGVNSWIKFPHKYSTNMGKDDANGRVQSAYLWNAAEDKSATTSNRNSVTKSLYDPCPYGFKVPPKQTFGSILQQDLLDQKKYYTGQTGDTFGGYVNANGQVGLVFINLNKMLFPMSGIRLASHNFAQEHYGDYGFYWTAGKFSDSQGNNLSFNNAYGDPNRIYTDIYGEQYNSANEVSYLTSCLAIFPIASSD